MVFAQALTRCVSYCFLHVQTRKSNNNYISSASVVLPRFVDKNGTALNLDITSVEVIFTTSNPPNTNGVVCNLTHSKSGADVWFGSISYSMIFTFVIKINVYVKGYDFPRYESFSNPCAVLSTSGLGESGNQLYIPVQLTPIISIFEMQ